MYSTLEKACKKINKNTVSNSCVETATLISLRCRPLKKAVFDNHNFINFYTVFKKLKPLEILNIDGGKLSHNFIVFKDENFKLYLLDSYKNEYKARITEVDCSFGKDILRMEFNLATTIEEKEKIKKLYGKYFLNLKKLPCLFLNFRFSYIRIKKFYFDKEFFELGYKDIFNSKYEKKYEKKYKSFFEETNYNIVGLKLTKFK